MSTSRSLAGLLGAVAAVVLALPPQADAACDLYQTIPDGRFRGPYTSTNGTYDTFYSLLNTTRAACSGTLILFDTAGTAVSTASLTIPAGGTASTNTSTMATGRNSAGTARFTHDCPPGAFLAEAAIASFAISPPYFQFVHFEGTREAKTH